MTTSATPRTALVTGGTALGDTVDAHRDWLGTRKNTRVLAGAGPGFQRSPGGHRARGVGDTGQRVEPLGVRNMIFADVFLPGASRASEPGAAPPHPSRRHAPQPSCCREDLSVIGQCNAVWWITHGGGVVGGGDPYPQIGSCQSALGEGHGHGPMGSLPRRTWTTTPAPSASACPRPVEGSIWA
jgi:hypothetical protein